MGIHKVPTSIVAVCKCGKQVILDATTNDGLPAGTCECGQDLSVSMSPVPILDLLGFMGIECEVDWDGQVLISSRKTLPEGLEDWLFENQLYVTSQIEQRGEFERAIYCGGPLNGLPHFLGYVEKGDRVQRKISHGRWCCYEAKYEDDPRMFYEGTAGTKRKGKAREFKHKPGDPRLKARKGSKLDEGPEIKQ